MPLTPSERSQVASYKIQIESYRKDLQNIKDRKKVDLSTLLMR
jgi:hypothetical protein